MVKIKDLNLPKGMTVLQNPNDVVASISKSRRSALLESVKESESAEGEDNGENKKEKEEEGKKENNRDEAKK